MSRKDEFAARFRSGERLVGYWSMLDSLVAVERVASIGFDFVCLDQQHGFQDELGTLSGLIAIENSANAVGLVRVRENSPSHIGKALDAGAAGVIVPLVDDADDARRAVAACRYPPYGTRSYGPIRSSMARVPGTRDRDQSVVCIVMVETRGALESVQEICAEPGVDALYVGPSDLSLALGARCPGDPAIAEDFEAALRSVVRTADAAGIAVGIHCSSGAMAAERLTQGFTFASVASDVIHLEEVASRHYADASVAEMRKTETVAAAVTTYVKGEGEEYV